MKNPVRIPENDLLWIDLQWFAAEDEGRTEDPTEYKLRKAREEGRVAKSQELNGALVLLIPALVLVALAPGMMNTCTEMIRFFLLRSTTTEINDPVLAQAFLRYFIKLVLPIAASAVVAGLASNLVQNGGFIFSVKPIAINMGKISPNFPKYFKRVLFSSEGLFNLAKSLMKV